MSKRTTSDLLREPKIPIGFLNALNRCTSREEVLSTYAEWSGRLTSADRTTVAMADADDDMLDVIAIDGNKVIATGSRLPIAGTLMGRVFQTQTPEICADLSASEDGEAPRLFAGGIRSIMDVPLSAGGRRFGVLAQGFENPPPPTMADLAILQAIGNCLGSHLLLQEQLVTLGELALTDPLTRVFNCRVFDDRIGELWGRLQHDGPGYSVAIIDLDHFKDINDSFGHDFGDHVLKAVADVLTEGSRKKDTVIRMGGEEFCVVLEDTGLEEAMPIVERLRRMIDDLKFVQDDKPVSITASIGGAAADRSHDSPRLVSILADQALYQAKKDGRNRVAPAA